MTTLGQTQLGVKAESTYGTPVVVDRFFPFIEWGLEPDYAVVAAADELRAGSLVERVDQDDPYIKGAAGTISMYVPTKGFGIWNSHALGAVATSGPTDSNYTHSSTLSATGKYGKSMTAQVALPLNPAGTAQPATFHGVKLLSVEWTMDEEGYLKASFDADAEDVDTSTALATAAYTAISSGGSKFPWRLCSVTIDGSQVNPKNWRVKVTWPMNVDRRFIRGSALKLEPAVSGKAVIDWDMEIEWSDLTQYNCVAASTMASRAKQIVITCDGAVALAGATTPQFKITIPAARFDKGLPTVSGDEPLMQSLSGIGLYDGSNEPITVAYRTTDSTP